LLYAQDAFDLVDAGVTEALEGSVAKAAAAIGAREDVVVSPDGLANWYETFRVLQAAEIWSNLGEWVQSVKPSFGPGIRERFEVASQVTEEDVAPAKAKREAIRGRMNELLKEGDVLCLPTSPRVAPLKDAPSDDLEVRVRQQAMSLLCIAGLAGLPQISLPSATLEDLPLGFSLIARWGADAQLLALARSLMAEG
jgi:amidase